MSILNAISSQAGSIYKCKQADGSISFSNVACPDNTVTREYKGEYRKRHASEDKEINYYSVNNQLQRMKQESVDSHKSDNSHISGQKIKPSDQQSTALEPTLTYEQARKKALEDAGYKNYRHLTGSQKETVDEEMAKYKYLPPDKTKQEIDEQNARNIMEQKQKEQEKIREVEKAYRIEKRKVEIGIESRIPKYKQAVKDCKYTPGAICR